jgi:hypothetical protein
MTIASDTAPSIAWMENGSREVRAASKKTGATGQRSKEHIQGVYRNSSRSFVHSSVEGIESSFHSLSSSTLDSQYTAHVGTSSTTHS